MLKDGETVDSAQFMRTQNFYIKAGDLCSRFYQRHLLYPPVDAVIGIEETGLALTVELHYQLQMLQRCPMPIRYFENKLPIFEYSELNDPETLLMVTEVVDNYTLDTLLNFCRTVVPDTCQLKTIIVASFEIDKLCDTSLSSYTSICTSISKCIAVEFLYLNISEGVVSDKATS